MRGFAYVILTTLVYASTIAGTSATPALISPRASAPAPYALPPPRAGVKFSTDSAASCRALGAYVKIKLANGGASDGSSMTIDHVISIPYIDRNPSIKAIVDSIPSGAFTSRDDKDGALSTADEWLRENGRADRGYGEQSATQTNQGLLDPFCRFGASIQTKSSSKVWFEVWLPMPTTTKSLNTTESSFLPVSRSGWRGRMVMSGGAAQRGLPSYAEMKQTLTRYREVAVSTNWGHFGGNTDVQWAISASQTQINFGHRGNHLATVAASAIVSEFYGVARKPSGRLGFGSYYKGCSSGGRQGLQEAALYPDSYDGVLAGSAANDYNYLNAYKIAINKLQRDPSSPRHIPQSMYPLIHDAVVAACDGLDGVKDAVISVNSTAAQQDNLRDIYADQYMGTTLLHEAPLPGSETAWTIANSVTGTLYPTASSWFNYQVLGGTNPDTSAFDAFTEVTPDVVRLGQSKDPGGTIGWTPNLNAFFSRGSKLLTYHGLQDAQIPPGSSERLYKEASRNGKHSGSYKYFPVPGMAHCRAGDGATNFGGAGQLSAGLRPARYDTEHDMLLALFAWTESGQEPNHINAAAYKSDSNEPIGTPSAPNFPEWRPFSNGVKFTRKLCPFPKQAVLGVPGAPNSADSYFCQ